MTETNNPPQISPAPREKVTVDIWWDEDGGISLHVKNDLPEDEEGSFANMNLYAWVRGTLAEGMSDLVKYADKGAEVLGFTDVETDGEEATEKFPEPIGRA